LKNRKLMANLLGAAAIVRCLTKDGKPLRHGDFTSYLQGLSLQNCRNRSFFQTSG